MEISEPQRTLGRVEMILLILLVAVLAFMLWITVFGGGWILHPAKTVTVTAGRDNLSAIVVTYPAVRDQSPLCWMVVSVNGEVAGQTGMIGAVQPLPSGEQVSVSAYNPGSDHVLVMGGFPDGTVQQVLDTYL